MGDLRSHRHEIFWVGILLLLATGVRLPGLFSRSIWYDEAITLLDTAGSASPVWPREPTPARETKKQFAGTPGLSAISADLRRLSIHPPVYYWLLSLWRQQFGWSLEVARAFSLICSLGSIIALYLLLRSGKIEHPLIPTTVYALSSGAVYYGQEARSYALASLFVVFAALFAYLAWEESSRRRSHATAWAVTTAICCGAAFHTHYLTVFPLCIILGWFVVNLWAVSRALALVAPLVTLCLASVGFSTLMLHLGARPHQFTGFVGPVTEVKKLLSLNLLVIWAPYPINRNLSWLVSGEIVLLASITCFQLFQHWQEHNRRLWTLLLGLACAPSLGIFFLDLFFNKHLHQFSYVIFAGPALSVLVAYGVTQLIPSHRLVGIALLILFLGFELVNINWGYTKGLRAHPGIDMRSFARLIRPSSPSPPLVVIGRGDENEPGHPGSVTYELKPDTMILVLDATSNLEEIQTSIQEYEDIWLVFSVDRVTTDIEQRFLNAMLSSGHYREVFREWPALHLRRIK